jgi:transposase
MGIGRKKRYRKFRLKISRADREKIDQVLHQNDVSTRIFRRALILRLLDRRKSVGEVAEELGVSRMVPRIVGTRYLRKGLERALNDAPRPGKPPLIDRRQEKEIVAVACSAPPGERARWTLKLLRNELISRDIISKIGMETLRTFLHEARVKPWLEKNVVYCGAGRRIHRTDGRDTRCLRR